MTPRRACRLLGVSANSSGEQIKAAYRRMASQWHPDRLARGSEHERQMATEQMAAINEAYSLLRSGSRQQAA
jgi:DnaJ-class molecular chaperone